MLFDRRALVAVISASSYVSTVTRIIGPVIGVQDTHFDITHCLQFPHTVNLNDNYTKTVLSSIVVGPGKDEVIKHCFRLVQSHLEKRHLSYTEFPLALVATK